MNLYHYAGCRVQSEIALELPHPTTDAAADLTIRRLDAAVTDLPRYERVVVRGHQGTRPVALGRSGSDWIAWIPPYLTSSIADELIQIAPFPVATDQHLNEHVIGNVLPFWLAARGEWAFHGSVVDHHEVGCVAVFGPSHAGKSTTAAALVANGGRLLADDTATGTAIDAHVHIAPTSSTLHLRGWAQTLARTIGIGPPRSDAEERIVVEVAHADEPVRLERLLFLTPGAESVGPRPLSAPDVVTRLLDNSRVSAWVDPEFRMREFDAAAEIAACVPGCEIGTPVRCRTADELIAYARAITDLAV